MPSLAAAGAAAGAAVRGVSSLCIGDLRTEVSEDGNRKDDSPARLTCYDQVGKGPINFHPRSLADGEELRQTVHSKDDVDPQG